MTNIEIIELLEKNKNTQLARFGYRMPFHIDELCEIDELNRKSFGEFTIGEFLLKLDSDGQCQYIEYQNERYYDFKQLKAKVS